MGGARLVAGGMEKVLVAKGVMVQRPNNDLNSRGPSRKDSQSWTTLLTAHVLNRKLESALVVCCLP